MPTHQQPRDRNDFEIAIICALRIEADAVEAMFDEYWDDNDDISYEKAARDPNAYALGRIGRHNVVLAYMPSMGKGTSASVAASFRSSFNAIRLCLVVGVCGGVPSRTEHGGEILLGDVVISTGVVQFDFGRQHPDRVEVKDTLEGNLARPNQEIRAFLRQIEAGRGHTRLKGNTSAYLAELCSKAKFRSSRYPGADEDILYPPTYRHMHHRQGSCSVCKKSERMEDVVCEPALTMSCKELDCDESRQIVRSRLEDIKSGAALGEASPAQQPEIHLGLVASGDVVMRSARHRDAIAAEKKVIAFEMEGAGVWDNFLTVVIKGVCDYADSHKNKKWQRYAAAGAAACMKAFLKEWRGVERSSRDKPAVPLQTPPKPSFTVPFRRDPDFVDRGDLLSRVDERCSQPGGRAALVGLGGVGKSQLAIEYGYRVRERWPQTWVFWVHASNAARFEQGYRDIADVVKISERNDPKADIFKLVHDWLRGIDGKWLMILDNIDDASFLVDAQLVRQSQSIDSACQLLRPLREYIPQSQNGSILITTRSRESALKLVEQKDIIMVNAMDGADAFELLGKKLESTLLHNNNDNAELVATLDFMPLAIVQAAAYISQLAPRYSVRQYIEEFQKSDRRKSSLLNYEGGHLRRDHEAKNSIIITWQISFEHIRRERQSAANLLSLMSFFDPQGIQDALVRTRAEVEGNTQGNTNEEEENNDSQSEPSEEDGFEEDVRTLRNFSFVTLDADPTVFKMHKLVQLATWKWLEANEQLERWKQQYIRNIFMDLPTRTYENWAKYAVIFPHIQSAIAQRPKERDSVLQWASILCDGAWYALHRGNLNIAMEMSTKVVKSREEILGQENALTLHSRAILGMVYNAAGRLRDAEELRRQVMKTSERVLGHDNPYTINSKANIASSLFDRGRWEEAEVLQVEVVKTSKRVLGMEHPYTLSGMSHLASTYQSRGRWMEAKELHEQVMAIRKRLLGVEHPRTLHSIGSLASVLGSLGRTKEAEALWVQVIETSKSVLGEHHPDTLRSVDNLALVLQYRGKYSEAEALHRRALAGREKELGSDHPDTLTSVSNLALVLQYQGNYSEAEALNRQALAGREEELGSDHPDTLTSVCNLALVLQYQGNYSEAEALNRRALAGREEELGSDHPDTLTSMNNLAYLLGAIERHDEATGLYERACAGFERTLGASHPRTVACRQHFANLRSKISPSTPHAELMMAQGQDSDVTPASQKLVEGRTGH